METVEIVSFENLSKYVWLTKVSDLLGEVTVAFELGGKIRLGTKDRVYSPSLAATDLEIFCKVNFELYESFASTQHVAFEAYRESGDASCLPRMQAFWE